MHFDPRNPTATDPSQSELHGTDYAWGMSSQPNTYYAWVQPIASEVVFHPNLEPLEVPLGFGVILYVYYGPIRQEMLYRIRFKDEGPARLALKPSPYCMFWSFGTEGGASTSIKYHYRDRYVTIHEWTDKKSFLAVLRQQHYEKHVNTIWSR
jgi:hypothetical protein